MNLTRPILYLFAIACLGIGLILPAHPALAAAAPPAEDVTYPGKALQPDPFGWDPTPNNLFPGTSANPGLSGNTVTVNGGVIDGVVFGGVSAGEDNVTNNRVFINGGTVTLSVFGGWS